MSNDYASKLSDQEKTALRLVHTAKYEGFLYRVDDGDEFKDSELFWASIPVFFVHAALRAFGYDLESIDPIAHLVELGLLRHEAQGHSPFGLADQTWRMTDDVHLEVTNELQGSLGVVTVRCRKKKVGGFEAPYGDRNCPSVTLTGKGLAACTEIGADGPVGGKPPNDVQLEEEPTWRPAANVVTRANRAARVEWQWLKWERLFKRHNVRTRPGIKKDGTESVRRRDVNVRDVERALKDAIEAGEFEEKKTVRDRIKQEALARVDKEFGSKNVIEQMYADD